MFSKKNLAVTGLLLALAAAWFSGLGYRKLADPDEGRYAEIPREMVVSHDWLTPRLNDIKYFEKPPLQYWATAIAYTLFGMTEWTARLWPALTGFLGVLITGFAGARLFGRTAGLAAALVLIGNLYYGVMGHIITLDMGLACFMTMTLLSFLLAQREPRSLREERCWMIAAWASTAAAVLSKGIVAAVLPVVALVLYSLMQRDPRIWRRLHPIAGGGAFLAIAAPWFIRVSLTNPEFAHFFFIHEHLERYTTLAHHRAGPLWYFVPLILIGLLPWTGMLWRAVRQAWRAGADRSRFSPARFLLAWAVAIFAFFSLSGSKLPAYVLPMMPAVALLIGCELARGDARTVFWRIAPIALISAAVIFGALKLMQSRYASQPDFALYEGYSAWIEAAVLVTVAATCGLYLLYRLRSQRLALIAGFALATLIASQLMVLGFEELSPLQSAHGLAQRLKPYLRDSDDVPVFSVEMYEQTLPPYLGRPIKLVAYQDELAFGLRQEPERWIERTEQFEEQWRALPRAAAIMPVETYSRLQARGLPMHSLEVSGKRCIVVRPEAAPVTEPR